MSTQWHPLFAHMLGLLLDRYYEIQTEVPVSDLPRKADILVVRRQEGPEPPFEGLWAHLTEWNILEFKGPSDSAHDDDLELLVHVGTGLTYRLNEERLAAGQDRLPTRQVSLWYLAPTLGETFLGQAQGRAVFEYDTGGVWRGKVWGHPIWLVATKDTRIEVDTIPLHLLEVVPSETEQLVHLLLGNHELLEHFAKLVYALHPSLWQEIRTMATQAASGPRIDWVKVGEYADLTEVLACIPPEQIVEFFRQRVTKDNLDAVSQLFTPEQLQEMLRKRQQSS